MEKIIQMDKRICAKEFLVKRMFFAIGSSIVVHFLLMSGVILVTNLDITHPLEWIQNTWNVVTCLRMWTYFIIFSIVVFVLGIICSKKYLCLPKYASSRFDKFCHIFTPQNFLIGSLYIFLGGLLAWLHLSVEGGRFGSLIKTCERLRNNCLVEEHYFLILEGFWIGLYFFLNSNYMGSNNLQFPIIPQSKISQVKRGIRLMLGNALLEGLWPVLYFFVFYAIFGTYFRDFFCSLFSLSLEELPLDKFSRLLSISLFFYAWLHAILFVLIMQSMHLFFQAYLTEWIPFDIETVQFTDQTKVTLTDALTIDSFPIIQQLGYLDLVTVAQKDKARRSNLFKLSQPGGHPYNWNSVVEKSLSLMKKFSDGLNSACSNQKEQVTQINKPVHTLIPPIPEKPYTYSMRSLVPPTPVAVTSPVKPNVDKATPPESFAMQYYKTAKKNLVNYFMSKKLISFIFAEQFENKIRHVLNDAQSVVWAADAISSLAALSLTEDPYGIVQKNLHEIIEMLLKLKQSLDKLQKLNISMRKPMSDDKIMRQTLSALRAAVRRSLYRIVSHFKSYINDLDLAPSTVDQLQPFFSFKE